MRYLWVLAAPLAAVMFLASHVHVTYASFHCMRIYSVMGSFNGNNNIQFIELREDLGGQNLVGGLNSSSSKIQFFDATGTLKATFTFPANVANPSVGASILIGSSEFNAAVTTSDPMARKADFTFSGNTVDPLANPVAHPIQVPAGKIVYAPGIANCGGSTPVDSVAYGGVAYTGATDYGSPALALPSDDRALRLMTSPYTDPPLTLLAQLKPSNNSIEYGVSTVSTSSSMIATTSLTTDATIPRNDPQWVLAFPAPSVGGIAEQPDVTALTSNASSSRGFALYVIGAAVVFVVTAAGVAGWRRRMTRTK